MSRSWKTLLVFAAVTFVIATSFVATASATEDVSDSDDEVVVTLTSSNFDAFIKDNEVTLVEFYAPWCGHCKKLAPEYEKAAKQLKEKGGIKIGKVDATKDEDLARKFEVSGYPTLKFFRNGKPEEYKGGRTAETIVSWIEMMTGPAVVTVADKAEAESFAAKSDVVFVGMFAAADNEQYKTFAASADSNRQVGKFVAYVDSSAKNEVVVYRKGVAAEGSHVIAEKDDLVKFCKEERFPHFGPIDGDNYGDYFEGGRDLVWFASEKEDYDENFKPISEVAKQFRSEHNFVWLNTEKFPDHAQSALGVKEFPSLVVQKKDGRYVFPHSKFEEAKVASFVKDVAAGKIEKFLMSDDVPPPSDSPVKVVVGKNFKQMVLRTDKDVLLEVYAPWCGHCKKFEPVYLEYAEKMATANPNLVVAKMDGTTNESPVPNFEWKGFPTIFLVKAGQKEPILFEGDRTLGGITEFVDKHVTASLGTEDRAKVEL